MIIIIKKRIFNKRFQQSTSNLFVETVLLINYQFVVYLINSESVSSDL